ncbi:hypothetical protein MMC25_007985 [Agyrium rufum]|nr:hypothetical protein [Agyrium rufum]
MSPSSAVSVDTASADASNNTNGSNARDLANGSSIGEAGTHNGSIGPNPQSPRSSGERGPIRASRNDGDGNGDGDDQDERDAAPLLGRRIQELREGKRGGRRSSPRDGSREEEDDDDDAQSRPSILPRASSVGHRLSFINDEARPTGAPLDSRTHLPMTTSSGHGATSSLSVSSLSSATTALSTAQTVPSSITPPEPPVRWRDLPHKTQLLILTLARLSEPLTQTSLQAYMFYQLQSFSPDLPSSTISSQAGVLQGSFTFAQMLTAMLWGRMADSPRCGRKMVLLVGLFGTGLSCVGFGFSRGFWSACFFRVAGGALNGNVGVMRTMISEVIREKKYQSRAFLLLPMCFNIGVIIGPIMGGLLADPVTSYPGIFGDNSVLGGKDGVWWMKHWPYALPNLISGVFLFMSAMGVVFGLEETLESIRDKPDLGLRISHSVIRFFSSLFRRRHFFSHKYTSIPTSSTTTTGSASTPPRTSQDLDLESYPTTPSNSKTTTSSPKKTKPIPRRRLPFRRIFTTNVISMLLCHAVLAFHVGTFQNLWYIFLSTPRFDPVHPLPPSHTEQHLPFSFTGGLGMPPRSVGIAMSVLGVIGITLQLALYPRVNNRYGSLKCYRWSLCLFPLAYILAPYLSIVPASEDPPAQASGSWVWLALTCVLFVQVLARTFALPANIILMNNASPHPSVLGTMHGLAQSVSSASRTVGPVLGGWLYGRGLQRGVVGGVWWGMAGVAVLGAGVARLVVDGDGHEIWLEGERGEGEEKEGREVGMEMVERGRERKREGEKVTDEEGPKGGDGKDGDVGEEFPAASRRTRS